METRILSTKITTTPNGFRTNLILCLVLRTLELGDVKNVIYDSDTKDYKQEFCDQVEHWIDLGVYWSDGREELFGYRQGPYTGTIAKFHEFDDPCWDLQKEWDKNITSHFIMELWKKQDQLHKDSLDDGWMETIATFTNLLIPSHGLLVDKIQKEVTPIGLTEIRNELTANLIISPDLDSENITKMMRISEIIKTALMIVMPFEAKDCHYGDKEPRITVDFDYRPQGFLSGLAGVGIEFPVWKTRFI